MFSRLFGLPRISVEADNPGPVIGQLADIGHLPRRKTVIHYRYPFPSHRLFRHGKIRRFRDGFVKPYVEALRTHTLDGFHFRTGRTVQSEMVSWSHPTERF